VTRLVFAPDGRQLVTASSDGTIRIWPTACQEFSEFAYADVTALTIAPDGSRFAFSDLPTAGPAGATKWVRVRSMPPEEDSLDLQFQISKAMLALAFSPDNRTLAAAERTSVHLWDLEKVQARGTIAESGVIDLSFSPDSQFLATATLNTAVNFRPDLLGRGEPKKQARPSQYVPAIKIWRSADGALLHTLSGQHSATFSPDGRRLAGAHDRSVKLWDVATGQELRSFSKLADPVLKVQFADKGRQIVGFTHHQATVWHADSGRIVATVEGLNGPASVTPDGLRIVGIHGKRLRWWDTRLGKELMFLTFQDKNSDIGLLALSGDGQRLAAARRDKLMIWQAAPEDHSKMSQ